MLAGVDRSCQAALIGAKHTRLGGAHAQEAVCSWWPSGGRALVHSVARARGARCARRAGDRRSRLQLPTAPWRPAHGRSAAREAVGELRQRGPAAAACLMTIGGT